MKGRLDNGTVVRAAGICIAIAASVVALVAPWSGAGASTAGAELRATPVGVVTSLAGSADLEVKPGGDGQAVAVQPGQSLYLGDLLIPGAGVEATVEVSRPSGVPARKELIDVRLAATVTVGREGSTTIVTIRG